MQLSNKEMATITGGSGWFKILKLIGAILVAIAEYFLA
jgi:bacteriocin-like protein